MFEWSGKMKFGLRVLTAYERETATLNSTYCYFKKAGYGNTMSSIDKGNAELKRGGKAERSS